MISKITGFINRYIFATCYQCRVNKYMGVMRHIEHMEWITKLLIVKLYLWRNYKALDFGT